MKFEEVEVKQKAGVIPYVKTEDGIIMLFMKPSDPAYGGPHYQIAKGEVDPGETSLSAALREGEEELGLLPSNVKNIKKLVTERMTGMDGSYIITIYAAEVNSPDHFGKPHYETQSTKWVTAEEFRAVGRLNQLHVVQLLGA